MRFIINRKVKMKTYKIHFTSDVYETVEVEAKNTMMLKKNFTKAKLIYLRQKKWVKKI